MTKGVQSVAAAINDAMINGSKYLGICISIYQVI